MRILDRHIGVELAGPFVFGVAAFTSIFFAGQYLLKLTSQVLQGTPVLTALALVILYLPSVIVYTLPMSALLAVLIAFSRLSNDSEVVALYASGVNLYRAMVPVVALGIIVAGMGFLMGEFVVPASNRLSQEIQARVLKEELSTDKPFVVIDKDTNSTIYVRGGLDAKSRTMRGVTITRYNGSAPVMIIQARKARWEGGNKWVLSDGTMYDPRPGGSGVSAVFEGAETQPIELHETPQEIALSQRKPEDMSFVELRRYIALLGGAGVPPDELVELQVDLYNKIAIPIAALVFSLIGAPLAIRPYRASPSIGLGLSVLIIFAYWFVWHFTTALSMQGSLPPMIGAFLADVLGLALGLILLARTAK